MYLFYITYILKYKKYIKLEEFFNNKTEIDSSKLKILIDFSPETSTKHKE